MPLSLSLLYLGTLIYTYPGTRPPTILAFQHLNPLRSLILCGRILPELCVQVARRLNKMAASHGLLDPMSAVPFLVLQGLRPQGHSG